MIIIGISIMPRGEGFEPVKVLEDLSYKFIYNEDDFLMTREEALREGRSLARAHNYPFRAQISSFKSLIKEADTNA